MQGNSAWLSLRNIIISITTCLQAIIKCKAESPLKEESIEKRIQKTVHKNKKISTQSDRLIKRLAVLNEKYSNYIFYTST